MYKKTLKSASIPFLKNSIFIELQQVRQNTLDLLAEIDGATPRRRYAERYPLGQAQGNAPHRDEPLLFTQAHPNFSPIGWHFGHIAFTEAYWILEQLAKLPPSFGEYHRLFAADGLPKKRTGELTQHINN